MKPRTTSKTVTPETLVSTLTADILNNVSFTEQKTKTKTGKIKVTKVIEDAQAIEFLKSDATKSYAYLQVLFASVLDGLKNKVTDPREKARQAFTRGEVSSIKNGSGKVGKKVNITKILAGVKRQMLVMLDATATAQSLLKDQYTAGLFAKYVVVPKNKSEESDNA